MSPDLVLWVALALLFIGFLALALFAVHRDAHEVSVKEAGLWSAVRIGPGLAFGGFDFATRGGQAGGESRLNPLVHRTSGLPTAGDGSGSGRPGLGRPADLPIRLRVTRPAGPCRSDPDRPARLRRDPARRGDRPGHRLVHLITPPPRIAVGTRSS